MMMFHILIIFTEPCESCRGKFLLCFRDDGDGMEPCKLLISNSGIVKLSGRAVTAIYDNK